MAQKKEDFAQQQKLLNKELKEGNFRRVYLVCGTQAYLRLQNRDRLRAGLIAPAPETLRGEITKPPYYSLVVTTLDDVSDPYDDVNSLREAVAYAETFDVPVTVTFADGLSGTILLADGAITVSAAGAIAIDSISARGKSSWRTFRSRAGTTRVTAAPSITPGT